MRLELDVVNIRNVEFANNTTISEGIVHINRRELQQLLQQDRRLTQVDIELAHPGDKCRIIKVSDVVEPRAKTGEGYEDFPGALGKSGTVGEGNTRVLRGAAVLMSDYSRRGESSTDPNNDIIDMSGPAAERSIYGKTHNVVVLANPADGVDVRDYRVALKIAGLKTAVYLAKAGKDLKPDEIEVYDLPPVTQISPGLEHLPKVAYIFQVISTQYQPMLGDPVLYGSNIDRIVPTILHPNEVLDGAILSDYRAMGIETYVIQNHPLIKELYRRHGKDLCFVGVIISIGYNNEPEYERAATIAANLVKSVLGADGVILTKSGGGVPEISMARAALRCEELGIKSAIAMCNFAADVSDSKSEGTVLFDLGGIDPAIVSMGTPLEKVVLPPVERIIGTPTVSPGGFPVSGEIERPLINIKGAVGQLGNLKLTAVRY
jgi:sarcosine reductase